MQNKSYHLTRSNLKARVDSEDWSAIDKELQQLPTGFYNFAPKQENVLYYKRLIYLLNNKSEGQLCLRLTAYILCLNTNNYYSLMLRSKMFQKKILQGSDKKKIQQDIGEQLYFSNCILNANPKQYQIWNYKKDILLWASSLPQFNKKSAIQQQEDFLFYLMTNDDQKNYHAWDYMSFLARYDGNLQQKFIQTDSKLFINITNDEVQCKSLWANCYSCWSYRFNLLINLSKNKLKEYVRMDCQKVMKFLKNNLDSQCAWNYLGGLADRGEVQEELKEEMIKLGIWATKMERWKNSRLIWSFLLMNGNSEAKQQSLAKLKIIDPIRQEYYSYLTQTQQ